MELLKEGPLTFDAKVPDRIGRLGIFFFTFRENGKLVFQYHGTKFSPKFTNSVRESSHRA